jgi:hypothetical protein
MLTIDKGKSITKLILLILKAIKYRNIFSLNIMLVRYRSKLG